MSRGYEIRQGDSLPLRFAHPDGDSLAGWACRVEIKAALADVTPLVGLSLTTLEESDMVFTGLLTSDTTSVLPEGDLLLLAEISKESEGRRREIHQVLRVLPQGVL
ncbi:MAG: hypothetical protein AAGI11_15205 [Pseudomonadota bacterium]